MITSCPTDEPLRSALAVSYPDHERELVIVALLFLPSFSLISSMFSYRFSVAISFVSLFRRCMGTASTTGVCTTAEWTFNQNGMSPCLVAANLEAVCNGGDWNIPALPPGSDYSGPTGTQATECTCSTVVYSMVAACSVCQQREFTTWDNWRENCSDHDVTVSLYPLTLPPGVTVPAWAYLNVTESNTFDPNSALSVHNAGIPDVGPGNSTSGPPPAPTETSPSNSGSSSNSHLGAIIGGVVGGIVLITIIACASYYLYVRWRRDYRGRSSSEKATFDMTSSPAPLNSAFPVPTIMAPPLAHELKLYDPTDPSTFPTSPAPSLPTYKSSDGHVTNYVSSLNEPLPPLPYGGNQGQYTGAPEV